MNDIKYIFRDFRGTVVKLDMKKHGYVSQVAKIYDTTRNNIWESLSFPMSKFRRGEISESEMRKIFSQNFGQNLNPQCLEIFGKKNDLYGDPYKNILKFRDKLKKHGYKNIILSDEVAPQGKNAEKLGLYNGFDDKILSCEVGLSKYDDVENNTTKIFDYALEKYGIKGNQAIFVDDTLKNCETADKLGIKTVLAQNSRQTIKDIKNLLNIK